MRFFVLLTVIFAVSHGQQPTPFGLFTTDQQTTSTPLLEWTGGSFQWPCPSTKSLYKNSGKYISKNIIATRAQILHDDVFLALPRYKSGVPATLAKTTIKKGSCQTTLVPFPCWSMQEEGNCQALQSVVDLIVDSNEILWVLDVGVVNTLETPIRKCPPKVVALSAKTGKVLKVVSLDGLVSSASRLQYLVVDYAADGRCYIYVSDAATRSIIVYDVQATRGFRVVLPTEITEGCPKRDVLYIALVRKSRGNSALYFTYLSSKRLFTISAESLRSGDTKGRVTDVGIKPAKHVIIGTDNGSAVFFRNEGHTEVFRWDTNTSYKESNFRVVHRSQSCQLATHAVADYKRGRMQVLESNFPDFMHNTVGCGAIQQITVMQGC